MGTRFNVNIGDNIEDKKEIKEKFQQLENFLENHLPGSREKSLVFTKLEEAFYFASLAIERSKK
jgi:hypothetical protein